MGPKAEALTVHHTAALLDPSVPLDGSIRSTQAVLHKARVSGIRRRRLGKDWRYECVRVCVWVPDRYPCACGLSVWVCLWVVSLVTAHLACWMMDYETSQ